MHHPYRTTLLLAVCTPLLFACQTPEAAVATPTQPSPVEAAPIDPSTCHSNCDATYENCVGTGCEHEVGDAMCPRECVDSLESCHASCG